MELEKYMLPCLSKTLFGVECLGCGFQRALLLLMEGDFGGAFKMYPAIYTTLLFLVIFSFYLFDKSRNYKNLLLFAAVFNGLIMIAGYLLKYF